MNSLDGKTAVVTGSGQGIGKAIALLLAAQGASVVTNSRHPDNTEGTAAGVAAEIEHSGGKALAVFADAGTMEGAKRIIQASVETYGAIDILVNNAGGGVTAEIGELTEVQWDYVILTNLKSQFAPIRHAVPFMQANKSGRIINIGSRVGVRGSLGLSAYAAAKAGVVGFTWSLAMELGPSGITVNCMMPTATTNRTEESRRKRATLGTPYHAPSNTRMPEHVAPIVAYLASEQAQHINGQLFYASGGEVTLYSRLAPTKTIYHSNKWSVNELAQIVPAAFGPDLNLANAPIPPP